jgi:hypothetical protein
LLAGPTPGLEGLKVEEESTESLANTLLDFSVAARAGEAERWEPYLAERLEALALPSPGAAKVKAIHAGVSKQDWTIEAAAPASRERAVVRFDEWLDLFGEIEDARFKLVGSHSDASGRSRTGRFKCWLVGRDPQGRRLWVKGRGDLSAKLDSENHWRLTRFVFTEAAAKRGEREIFTECSAAAGVARDGIPLAKRTEVLRSYGAAAGDVDGDGLVDVYATSPTRGYLYLNQGDGTFKESGMRARAAILPRPALAPLFVDHDGDGDLDIFLTAIGPQILLENRLVPDGKLRFKDVSARAGVEVHAWGHSASAGDVNGDGLPDIHVASYGNYPVVVPDSWDGATNGTPNLLFLNQGEGRFREAAKELGVADGRWSYASAFVDFDDDGDLDLTVSNDFGGAVGLFLNQGPEAKGPRFRDVAAERGLGKPTYGMGVSFGDPDSDGDLDLHVTKMSSTAGNRILDRVGAEVGDGEAVLRMLAKGNDLYENTGDGRFEEITDAAGPFGAGWAWGGGFVDVDNDGNVDIYSPNGFLSGELLKDT